MLGSLARKLRIFGFDTAYFTEGGDAELEALARREGRVVLTSDKSLCAHSRGKGLEAYLVTGRTDLARLRTLQAQEEVVLGLGKLTGRASRCAECNGELLLVGKREAAEAKVPAKVLASHRLFFRCTSCSRFYWHGSHWARLRRLSSSIRTRDST